MRNLEGNPFQDFDEVGAGIDFTGDLIDFDCNWIRHEGVVFLILTVVRLLSFISLVFLVTFGFTGCAQKSSEPESKIDIPKPGPVAPPEDTRPVVVCFGDSITAGFGLEAGQTYPDVLQKLLDAKGYKYRVVNAGVSGDTTQSGLDRIYHAMNMNPKVTLVELGGNDGLRGVPVERTRDNLVQIAGRFRAKGSKVAILGITLPRNYGAEYIRRFEANFKLLETEHKYPLMPFVLEGVYGQKGMMQTDGIHPTVEGAARIASNIMKYLEPMLEK
ncbi:MAG: arylesterase [Acidobacteria bacterium]|nr:arylesterase [Acidobacteriota bacterium]